jgi:hypothetical protein
MAPVEEVKAVLKGVLAEPGWVVNRSLPIFEGEGLHVFVVVAARVLAAGTDRQRLSAKS